MEKHLDIGSVLLYLCMFAGSCAFLGVGEHYIYRKDGSIRRGKRKIIGIAFVLLGILIPCLFATYRGLGVGRDVGTYIVNNFQYGTRSGVSFSQFRSGMPVPMEFLFTCLMYICCKLGSIHLLFFLIEFLVMFPLAIVAVNNRGKSSLVLFFGIFFFLFYNFTLSGMRQSIAMSILIAAVFCYLKCRKLSSILLLIVAQLFHSSVILIVAIMYVCYRIINTQNRKTWSGVFAVCLLVLLFAFSVFADRITHIVTMINSRYGFYARQYLHAGFNFGDIYSTDIILKTLLVMIPWMLSIREGKTTEIDMLMLMFALLGRYFVVFNGVFYESMRIAFYFDFFGIIYISKSIGRLRRIVNRFFLRSLYIMIAFIYWLYYYMYIGGYTTNVFTWSM